MASDDPGYTDLGFARLDTDRLARTGDPEVVYGAGKTTDQIVQILRHLHRTHPERAVLATRVTDSAAVAEALSDLPVTVADEPGAVVVGELPDPTGTVGIIAAGTSDGPVAAEAALTVQVHGARVTRITDVGVAGLHRVLATREVLDDCDCLIVVAGMEGRCRASSAVCPGRPSWPSPRASATAHPSADWRRCSGCSIRAHRASSW